VSRAGGVGIVFVEPEWNHVRAARESAGPLRDGAPRSLRGCGCDAARKRRRIASADSVGFRSAAFEAMQCKHQTVLH
jgi:hypothetical protein